MQLLKRLCQCIGVASLVLVMNYGDMLGGGADVRMHVPFALGGIVAAQLADMLLLGLVLFAVLVLSERTRYGGWVRLLLAIAIPPYLVVRLRWLVPFDLPDGLMTVIAILWGALLLLLLLNFPRWYRRLFRAADRVGLFLAIFAGFSIVQLLFVALWKPGPQQHMAAWEASAQPPRQHPLVVWIVFDELSYDQLFEHRAHDLALPNFDALRSQSTLFTDVQPIGIKTVKVIPSLFSGHVVEDYRFSLHNRLSVRFTGAKGWQPLAGPQTVFSDAQSQGWRTAVVGWYNPYCTLYAGSIDDCYWTNHDRLDGMMAQDKSLGQNMLSPLQQLAGEAVSEEDADRDLCSYDVRQRYRTHIDLQQHAFQLLRTGQADFVFLHFSNPHSPNIWNRADGAYTQTCGSSYLDNLALVDRVLGQVLGVLKQSPRWKDTTLIVEGDHSWRIAMWDWLPAWTPEDEEASRGVYDPRPALLIHEAGQTQPATVATPWSLVRVHDVLEQVVHGQPMHF